MSRQQLVCPDQPCADEVRYPGYSKRARLTASPQAIWSTSTRSWPTTDSSIWTKRSGKPRSWPPRARGRKIREISLEGHCVTYDFINQILRGIGFRTLQFRLPVIAREPIPPFHLSTVLEEGDSPAFDSPSSQPNHPPSLVLQVHRHLYNTHICTCTHITTLHLEFSCPPANA